MSTLTIKDRVFDVTDATFGASIGHYEKQWNLSNPYDLPEEEQEELREDEEFKFTDWMQLRWNLEIATAERDFEDTSWKPRVYGEDMILEEMAVPNALVGTTLHADEYDYDRDLHLFSMYVYEHTGISRNSIRFLERNGCRFKVAWTGKCSVNWDDEYGEDLDFSFDGWLEFCGIAVRADSQKEALELLGKRLDVSQFKEIQPSELGQACLRVYDQPGFWYQLV